MPALDSLLFTIGQGTRNLGATKKSALAGTFATAALKQSRRQISGNLLYRRLNVPIFVIVEIGGIRDLASGY